MRLTEGGSWWPTEVIREEHVAATIAGGPAAVMLSHDSAPPPYCTEPVAVVGVRPRLLVHGHFHVAGASVVRLPGVAHDTTIWSLAANQDPANVRLLDLDTLTDPDRGRQSG